MAYGAKKGVQPGDLGVGDFFGFAGAAATGIVVAVALDFFQKKEASAIVALNVFMNDFFGQSVPLFYVIGALMAIGAGSTFVFEPTTRSGAFSTGVGLLAAIMTALPVQQTNSFGAAAAALPPMPLEPVHSAPFHYEAQPRFASYTPEAKVYRVQNVRAGYVIMNINVTLSGGPGMPENLETMIRNGQARARLHSSASGMTWGLFKGAYQTSSNSITFGAPVPLSAIGDSSEMGVVIEIPGYAILQSKRTVTSSESVVNWPLTMRPNNQPLWMQRLRTPYAF
ncbi:MAG: hypothetical protein AAGC95_17555 [Pseudomonadota bacterium]